MKTKKMVALLLSVAMVVSAVPFAVLADEAEITEQSEATEIVAEEIVEPEETEEIVEESEPSETESAEAAPEESAPEETTPEETTAEVEEITEEAEPETYDASLVDTGSCGDDAFWELDSENTLTIGGNGIIDNPTWSTWQGHNIRKVVIEEGITQIDYAMFYNSSSLETVIIADSVVFIDEYAFANCGNLTSVRLSNRLTSIANHTFYKCYNLRSIDIPDSVTSIDEDAFRECRLLGSVGLNPTSRLDNIGPHAFCGCLSLSSIYIPKKVKSIRNGAFEDCQSLTSVDIWEGDAINEFGENSFRNCTSITSFTIPLMTRRIGKGVFEGCVSLTDVYLLSARNDLKWEVPSVNYKTTVHTNKNHIQAWSSWTGALGDKLKTDLCGSYAIWNYDEAEKTLTIAGCGDMSNSSMDGVNCAPWRDYAGEIEKVVIGNGITAIGRGNFAHLENLKVVVFEGNSQVKYIGKDAFLGCVELTTVEIDKNSSLEQIMTCAFSLCEKLNGMVIPRNVKRIEDDAFYGCEAMTDIYSYADPSVLGANECFYHDYAGDDFRQSRPLTKFHIPEGTSEAYLTKTEGLLVDFVEDVAEMGDGVALLGHSINLKGNIEVDFYVELASDILADPEAYMLFTLANGTTKKVLVSEAADDSTTVPGKTCKVFACEVAPVQIGDAITSQIFMGDGTSRGEAFTYTVRQYVDEVISHRELYPGKVQSLVKAMASYGAYAQVFFGYPDAGTATADLSAYKYYFDFARLEDHLNQFGPESIVAPAQFAGATLELETEVNLRLWFKGLPAGTKFMLESESGSVELPVMRNGKYTIAIVSDIPAQDLDSFYQVRVVNETEGINLLTVYSPMNYCYNVVHPEPDANSNEALQNLVKALHFYNYFANQYSGEN